MAGIIVNFQSSKSAVAQEGFESFKYFFLVCCRGRNNH
jgi:hypothetical protein